MGDIFPLLPSSIPFSKRIKILYFFSIMSYALGRLWIKKQTFLPGSLWKPSKTKEESDVSAHLRSGSDGLRYPRSAVGEYARSRVPDFLQQDPSSAPGSGAAVTTDQ
jgi:hypothetical protein